MAVTSQGYAPSRPIPAAALEERLRTAAPPSATGHNLRVS
jgi:hypothetical protein